MTTFILKLIAMVTMLIDHIAFVFGWEGWDLLSVNASSLRSIGRIAFPIFAFFIVNGWKKTRDRKRYFLRLCLCAIASQIPFSLAFYTPNTMKIAEGQKSFLIRFNPAMLAVGIIAAITYWYFAEKRKTTKSAGVVMICCLIPAILLKVNHIWVMADNLNVLYTFVVSIVVIYGFEKIKERSLCWWEYIWLIFVIALVLVAYGLQADYGIAMMGVSLVVILYFTQGSRVMQCLAISIWGCIYYGIVIGNWYSAAATIIPAALMLTYNQKIGLDNKFAKYLFYIFYPLHMLIIGIINICIKL